MNKPSLQDQLLNICKQILRFRVVLFLVVLAGLYGFVVLRVNTLSNVQPDQASLSSKTSTPKPHIDKATLDKIKQLQDNSVNVRSLFDQARKNPFQE